MNKLMLLLLLAINVTICLGGDKCAGEGCGDYRECKDGCLCRQPRGVSVRKCVDRDVGSCPTQSTCDAERATCKIKWTDASRDRHPTVNDYKFHGKTFGDALLKALEVEYDSQTAPIVFNAIKGDDAGLTVRVNGALQGAAANSKLILDQPVPVAAKDHTVLIQTHKTNPLAAHRGINNKMKTDYSAHNINDEIAEQERESLVSSPVNQYYSFKSNDKGSEDYNNSGVTDTNTLFMVIVVLLVVIIACFACIFTGIAGIFIGRSLNKSNDKVPGYRKMDQIDNSI